MSVLYLGSQIQTKLSVDNVNVYCFRCLRDIGFLLLQMSLVIIISMHSDVQCPCKSNDVLIANNFDRMICFLLV